TTGWSGPVARPRPSARPPALPGGGQPRRSRSTAHPVSRAGDPPTSIIVQSRRTRCRSGAGTRPAAGRDGYRGCPPGRALGSLPVGGELPAQRRASRTGEGARMGLLSRLVRRVARRDCPWREVRGQLRPVLRTITTGTALAGPARPLHAPTVPYLAEMVVVDQPTSMAYVGSDRLTEWGVRREAVFAAARGNLARRAVRAGGPAAHGPVRLRCGEDGASYWSSCLLLDRLLGTRGDRAAG